MARRKTGDKKLTGKEVGVPKVQADDHSIAFEELHVGGNVAGDIRIGHTIGYTADQVSVLLKQITTTLQPKKFDGRCPYKGLEVFEEEDAELFFGRERLVTELVGRVKESRTVFITGPSGSGKSSLVRAGLIHALKQGVIKSSERWLYETMKPGREPLKDLALAFSRLKSPELQDYFLAHMSEADILNKCAESVLSGRKDQRFVLFIDQFEEVFTQINAEEERVAFINMLAHAGTVENGRVIVLFAMRSDFVSNCATYPALNELLSQEFRQIGAMQPEELVSAIALPARHVGLPIEDELIARIINDMKGEPDALPLMQFALKDLFDAKQVDGGVIALTLKDYLQHGGIHKSLERHADATFAKLSESEQELTRSIFSGLIEIGRGTQDTKRTALFDELIPASAKSEDVLVIVQKLADARLIITDEQAGKDTVTISHEKLIEAWPWLKKLVNENRDAIALQNEIAADAKEWEDHQRDTSYLYSGTRLANISEQLNANKLVLSETSNEFVKAGQAKEKRDQRTRVIGIAVPVGLVIVAVILFSYISSVNSARLADERLVAVNTQAALVSTSQAAAEEAQKQTTIALARQLAFQSQLLNLNYGSLAIQSGLLAVEAAKLSPTIEVNQALHRYLETSGSIELVLYQPDSRDSWYPWSIKFSPDGKQIGTLEFNGNKIHVWDIASGKEITDVSTGNYSWLYPSTENLFTSEKDNGVLRLINYNTNEEIGNITTNGDASQLVSTLDGEWLVVDICSENNLTSFYGCTKGNIQIWDTKKHIKILDITHNSTVERLKISPDKKWILAAGCSDLFACTIFVWDASTGKEIITLPNDGTNIGVSPDSKYIVSGNSLNLRIWELGSFREVANKGLEGGQIAFMGFSTDGRFYLWYEGFNGSNLNNLLIGYFHNNDFQYSTIAHSGSIYNYSISPEIFANYIVTGSADGTARLSEMWSGKEIARSAFDSGVVSNAFSPNGKIIASLSSNGEIHVWNTIRGGRIHTTNEFKFEIPVASPSGRYFLFEDGAARHIIDKKTGKDIIPPLEFSGSDFYRPPIAFSNNDEFIAYGRNNNTHLMQTSTGDEFISIPNETQVISIAVSSDDQLIVWLEENRVYHVWDLKERKEVDRGSVIQTGDYQILFSPDGKYLLSSSDNSNINVWVWKIEDLVLEACKRVARNFTRAEWAQYFPNEEYRKTCDQWPLEADATAIPSSIP
jgi:WD40 repeat protein